MKFLIAVILLALPVLAEEGMWTFDNPPVKQLKEKYDFTPARQWLDHVRLSSVRLNDGGSGSFVSPNGLLLTNHHVARGQLQKNSTAEHDYIKDGFYAATPDQEIKSPDLEVNVLMSMEDVTARVLGAQKQGETVEKSFAARKSAIADIERESQEKTGFRSEVVTLYQGGEYWLYRYKKYTDVRIVFAPEQQAAYFGGDPDNFTFPRHDIDMALFRVYENGKPIESKEYLRWNPKGAADDELVFVSGHPGSTERLDTVSQLHFERDFALPLALKLLRNRVDVLRKYSATSPEHARQASSEIFNMENSIKALDGEYQGLLDPRIMAKKEKEEADFRARVNENSEWKSSYGGAWDALATADKKSASRIKENYFHKMNSELGDYALRIVQYVAEIKKPDGQRLAGYHDSQLDSFRFELDSAAPIYKDMEIARITGALEQDLKEMGPQDPYVKMVLDGKTPHEAAAYLVNGTKLEDPAARKQLVEGGEAAVAASTDPMVVLARKLDPLRREFVRWQEDNVQSVAQRAGEQIGKARFAAYGKTTYPDATFTLRLSYGTIKGYPMNGTAAPPKTTFYGLYDRAASFGYKEPWNLTSRFAEGRDKLNLSTPLDFVTTNDIIGGNSGSPVINRNGELVGLIFDGNIESLVGNYVYDMERNRAVAVHTAAMTEVMRKLYGAQKLLDEIMPGGGDQTAVR
jgi:hypothetical protein